MIRCESRESPTSPSSLTSSLCGWRPPVTAQQLLEFLEGLDERAQEWVDALIARVDHHDSYIIEAEEY